MLAVELLSLLTKDLTARPQRLVNLGRNRLIFRAVGGVEDVEVDAKLVEVFDEGLARRGDQRLWLDPLLARVHLNRRTVRVGCAMKVHVLSEQPLGSDGDVRLDVLDKVADVQLSVGVG